MSENYYREIDGKKYDNELLETAKDAFEYIVANKISK